MFKVEYFVAKSPHWLIRQFEIYNFTEPFFGEKYIPRPDVALIFHFKQIPVIENNPPVKLLPYFLVPVISKSLPISANGETESFIVICKPTVLSRVLNLDLSPSEKYGIKLPEGLFDPLREKLSVLKTAKERVACFMKFVNELQTEPYLPDAVDSLYENILEMGITTPVKDLVRKCNASQRSLERHFIKRTGVSPKALSRIVRLYNLWTNISPNKRIDYQLLVENGNYFDQSHFINDFKTIVGERPGEFFKRDLNLVKKFAGK